MAKTHNQDTQSSCQQGQANSLAKPKQQNNPRNKQQPKQKSSEATNFCAYQSKRMQPQAQAQEPSSSHKLLPYVPFQSFLKV